MLRLIEYSRYYGYKKVLDNIDFELHRNQIVCLLGPNGAGKTTFLEGILSHNRQGRTKFYYHSKEIHTLKDHYDFLKNVSYLGHEPGIFLDLTLIENLYYLLELYKPVKENLYTKEEILDLIYQIGLYERRNDLVRNYSRGMKQRAGLLRSIITKPELLLLDEPITGLDIQGKEFLVQFLESFKKNASCIIVTHDEEIFSSIADRYVYLFKGKIIADVCKEKYNQTSKRKIQELIQQYSFDR
jgi:ABC-type multidrug transport system ATPase subunit